MKGRRICTVVLMGLLASSLLLTLGFVMNRKATLRLKGHIRPPLEWEEDINRPQSSPSSEDGEGGAVEDVAVEDGAVEDVAVEDGAVEDEDAAAYNFPRKLQTMESVNAACDFIVDLALDIQQVHKTKQGLTIHVVTAADLDYLPGLVALVNSTIMHTRNPVSFHVVTDAHAKEVEWFLRKLFPVVPANSRQRKVTFEVVQFASDHRVASLIKVYKTSGSNAVVHGNLLNYARFYFHELFPKLEKVVYMDPDTIMLGNVVELATILDHQNEFLYAVAQGMPHTYAQGFDFAVPLVQNSFSRNEPYFNAGVAVVDLVQWRERNVTDTIEWWMEQHRVRKMWSWGTQPPLMAAFYRHYHMLDSSWNVRHLGVKSGGMAPSRVELVRAKVLHWNGPDKPWSRECRTRPSCFVSCWAPFYDRWSIRSTMPNLPPALASLFL